MLNDDNLIALSNDFKIDIPVCLKYNIILYGK